MADELTAVLGGLLGYVAVLAAIGVGVIYLLDMDVSAAIEPEGRSVQAAVERPYVVTEDRSARLSRTDLSQAVATK